MTDQQKMDLHQEAKMIYEMYFKADAADKIQFPADVTAEIKSSQYLSIIQMFQDLRSKM